MIEKDIKNSKNLALLPNGFVDLLPPFAEMEANSIRTLMDKFSSFGYQRVKPPLLEFEDSLLAPGPGELLANDTFRLMDPITHRMLGVRSDITAQVSRIVTSRMGNDPRPLRLAYANDVLRTRGSQISSERQFVQAGCELVGDVNGCESEVEVCVLSILGLKSLGIKDITLDLTIPEFVSYLLSGEVDIDMVEKAVKQRDIDVLLRQKSSNIQMIAKAMGASGVADDALLILDKIKFDEYLRGCVNTLKQVCAGVKSAMLELGITDVSLSIDVIEQKGFEYHKKFGFTLFSKGFQGELGRGGSYDVHFSGNEYCEKARGFTLYMNNVLKIVRAPTKKDSVFVSSDYSWNIISILQDQGWVVIRGVGGGSYKNNCSHIYENGEIKELKSEDLL